MAKKKVGLQWKPDDLGESEEAEKFELGIFEVTIDKRGPNGLWWIGIYVSETTDLVVSKDGIQALHTEDAKKIAMDWAKGIFSTALQAAERS